MSDEARKGMTEDEKDEVEAHRSKIAATDEPGDEMRKGETDDEVEAHRFKTNRPAKGI
jgi:hypothetical protein